MSSRRPDLSGRSKVSRWSNRPGRKSAESSASGRLVDAMSMMLAGLSAGFFSWWFAGISRLTMSTIFPTARSPGVGWSNDCKLHEQFLDSHAKVSAADKRRLLQGIRDSVRDRQAFEATAVVCVVMRLVSSERRHPRARAHRARRTRRCNRWRRPLCGRARATLGSRSAPCVAWRLGSWTGSDVAVAKRNGTFASAAIALAV